MSAANLKIRAGALFFLLVLVGGCVVGDQLTTFTIHPDGSADFVVFRSNLRSTEKGGKAAKELAEYKARFDGRTEGELTRVVEAGGTLVDASWVREQVPLSSLVHARFPDAAALEKFLTMKNEDGSFLVKTRFQNEGARRSLSFHISLAKGESGSPPTTAEQVRQSLANAISETRIALSAGTITAARGFIVAGDKQSALLDSRAIDEIIRTTGKGELYLEWEAAP
jgi:hypothetical protein